MNKVKAMGMNEEDCMICKAFFIFMFTPLLLLVMVGAVLAATS